MISLARKYRPRRFADLVVQDHVAAALRGAVARHRVGHGYLLTGPRGVGKTTAARILAMALNCERRDQAEVPGEPCGTCPTCERIWSGGASFDVVEIDAASNRSVDDARELRERAMYAASDERSHKVYIVDEAHMLTREAWNALLKILEEPPPRVVFVFATTEPQKIANTAAPVLSRLQRFDFRRIGAEAIRTRLREVLEAEHLSADDDALTLIARYADGGMRDALSVLDQCLSLTEGPLDAAGVRRTLGLIGDEAHAAVLRAVAARDPRRIFPVVDELVGAGADLVEFMNGQAELLRSVLMTQTGVEPEGLTAPAREAIAEAKDALQPGDVLRMLNLLAQAETAIRRSANPRLTVETLLLRWTLMDRTVDLEAVLRGAGAAPPSGVEGRRRPFAGSRAAEPGDPAASQPVSAEPGPALQGEISLERLRAAWPEVIARGRSVSLLLGPVLEALEVRSFDGKGVALAAVAGAEHMLEGARRQEKSIAAVLAGLVGRPIRVSLGDPAAPAPRSERPKRISDNELRDERLRELRGLDPALDKAADALDLEIVE